MPPISPVWEPINIAASQTAKLTVAHNAYDVVVYGKDDCFEGLVTKVIEGDTLDVLLYFPFGKISFVTKRL
jgi:hypothetical protein